MPTALTPIAWQTVSSNVVNVTFNSIPQTYRDLYIVYYENVFGLSQTQIRYNGDTGSNYISIFASGNGTSATSNATALSTQSYDSWVANASVGAPGTSIINILDYSATDKHKTAIIRFGAPSSSAPGVEMACTRWASTAAITSINFNGAFGAGSTFAIYGVVG